MKRIFQIFCVIGVVALLAGCEMDHYRSDTMTSAQLKDDPASAVYTTDGNYSMFKDTQEYRGTEDSGLTYQKMWFHMAEMRGDNVNLSGRTTSPIYNSACYNDDPTLKHGKFFWWIAYKIIFSANTIIESLPEGVDAANDHLLGENYFLRAISHLNLSCLFSRQYSHGRDNKGIVLRTSTDCSITERATVGEVYDQIVSDLQKAAELMKNGSRRGDAGYASYEAARGLLTRVYLYREEWDKVIELANEMIGADPDGKLDPDVANYFINARNSKETLWCIANTVTDTRERSSLGSMYFSPDGTGGTGWGECYASDPLLDLFERNPEDKRYAAYFSLYGQKNDGLKMVTWPVPAGSNLNYENCVAMNVARAASGKYEFDYSGKHYVVEERPVYNYTEYYIQYEGKEQRCYVRENTDAMTGIRNSYPQFYCSKFAWQDGDPNLSSPVMIRWAEVILNRAEAYAMMGNEAAALTDVNVIRRRAGIPEITGQSDMAMCGYTEVIDVVNDERRLELCYEAHRPFDVYRQKRSMDRRFAGVHPWEVVSYDDPRILFRIPFDEISVSGIEQNP
ncbi:MAG: RagB/SusD family nutrient uptake outer membrane protein [Tidjanibacter sp.]|nr:RagB/SusD family nutrient uptake outer membrane protein [Tidjanibacter sp.]